MVAVLAPHTGGIRSGMSPYRRGLIFSFVFHILVIAGVPLIISLAKSTMRFERPQTFQLVAAPPSLRPFTPAAQKKLSKEQVRKIKRESARPVPRQSAQSEENLDELASMLEELPQPARVASVGDTKFNPYFAEVQQKIERYWTPPSENRNISVVVAFTIYVDGSISEPQIEKSSGDATLDDMALRAVRLAAPFRKLPLSVAADKKDFICTLIPVRR